VGIDWSGSAESGVVSVVCGGAGEEPLEVNVQEVAWVVVFSGLFCEIAFDAEDAVCTLFGVALSPTHTVQ